MPSGTQYVAILSQAVPVAQPSARMTHSLCIMAQTALGHRMKVIEEWAQNVVVSVDWMNDRLGSVERRMESAIRQWGNAGLELEHRVDALERNMDEDNLASERRFDRQACLENRMNALEKAIENHGNEFWEWVAHIEKRTNTIETSTKEQIASGIRWSWDMNRDFNLAEHRQASLDNRMEEFEKSTKEQIACVLQEFQSNREQDLQTARELAATLFVLENHIKAFDKSTNEKIAGVLQALQTAKEQATSDFVSAHYWQARLKTRMESIETLTKAQLTESIEKLTKLTEEYMGALQTAAEQVAREFAWATVCENDRQASIENRVEAIEQRQTATEQAASANRRQASFETRVEPIEIADNSAVDEGSDAEYDWCEFPAL